MTKVLISDLVIGWLLDADPAIRWQVLRDLTDESGEVVARERSRVVSEGWGAALLDRQSPDGTWGDGTWRPILYTLLLLRNLGIDPSSERARTAVGLVRDQVTWGPEFGDSPFFESEVEPVRPVSTWKMGQGSPAAGTHSALCGCWIGLQEDAAMPRQLLFIHSSGSRSEGELP